MIWSARPSLLIVPSEYLWPCRGRDILSKERDLRKIRDQRLEKLEALGDEIIVQDLGPCDIAARLGEAVDESCSHEITFGAVSLKPWSSKCRSMRSSHGAIQPPPDSRNATRNRG